MEPTTDYYTDLITVLVHLNRYLVCKVKEKTERRNTIFKYMNRIYRERIEMHTFEDRKVKCRKAHRCLWCGEDIAAGDIARYLKSMDAGYFYRSHWHLECDAAYKRDPRDYWYDGVPEYENLRGVSGKEHDRMPRKESTP